MRELELRSEVLLKNHAGERDLGVTHDWQVLLDGGLRPAKLEDAVVLDGLIRHTNQITNTGEIWQAVRADMPNPRLDPASAKESVNRRIASLRERTDLPVSKHLYRLGKTANSIILFLDDVRTPDTGLQVIEQCDNPGLVTSYMKDFEFLFGDPTRKRPRAERRGLPSIANRGNYKQTAPSSEQYKFKDPAASQWVKGLEERNNPLITEYHLNSWGELDVAVLRTIISSDRPVSMPEIFTVLRRVYDDLSPAQLKSILANVWARLSSKDKYLAGKLHFWIEGASDDPNSGKFYWGKAPALRSE